MDGGGGICTTWGVERRNRQERHLTGDLDGSNYGIGVSDMMVSDPAARHPRKGAVLIVVLGVLVVLSLLGITFTRVSALDRSVARDYLDGIRAQLAARAGVERAVAGISASAERDLFNPPVHAKRPEGPGEVSIDGCLGPVDGVLGGGTYAPNGDVFRVKVADSNSKIHVNDGLA